MKLDIRDVPFSIAGSYFAISMVEGRLILKDLHGGHMISSRLFEIMIDDFSDIYAEDFLQKYQVTVTETSFICSSKNDSSNYLAITFNQEMGVRIKGNGIKMSLIAAHHQYNTFYQSYDSHYEFISYFKDRKYQLSVLEGTLKVDAPWGTIQNDWIKIDNDMSKIFEIDITSYQVTNTTIQEKVISFKELLVENQIIFEKFKARFNLAFQDDISDLAMYILWSNQVRADGELTQDAVLMSKNWMQNIWSWDNCFTAMALAESHPTIALQQFQIFFDHQSEEGAYPDLVNNRLASYSCVKPPIFAWAYQEMINRNSFFKSEENLKKAYVSIAKNTDFWFLYRRHPQTNLFYYSHGNDSGWDNATVFRESMPVSSPDLLSYLVKQCAILERWSEVLFPTETSKWVDRKEELIQLLVTKYYSSDFGQFVAYNARTSQRVKQLNSLILRMPLFISEFLPRQISDRLVADLTENFETEFGLATEAIKSKDYTENGYWLGPIWAPVNYMIINSLLRNNYEKVAQRLSGKFMELVRVGGMAENYNAITGSGNDDLGFAWSAACFLLLAHN